MRKESSGGGKKKEKGELFLLKRTGSGSKQKNGKARVPEEVRNGSGAVAEREGGRSGSKERKGRS